MIPLPYRYEGLAFQATKENNMKTVCSNTHNKYWLTLSTLLTILVTWASLFQAAHASDELLEVDQAFELQAPTIQDNKIIVEWKIADDYKLYKDKMEFTASQVTLDPPEFSKAKLVDDVLFGKTEVFEGKATATIPYSGAADTAELSVKYQGCATKIGVCYPPQTRKFNLSLPEASQTTTASTSSFGSLSALNSFLNQGNTQPELLEADDAFAFQHSINKDGILEVQWTIAEDYHLYHDKIKTSIVNGDASLAKIILPQPVEIDDPLFGKTTVFHGEVLGQLPFNKINSDTTVEIEYQGCSAASGVCYPPIKKQITVKASQITTGTPSDTPANIATATVSSPSDLSESDLIADTIKNSNVWIVILTFFVFGLLLAFTPCIFPMIPILSSIIVGQGEQLTTRRAFMMSLVYVLAMSVTYTVAGVLAGIFGENLQAAFQNPWIIGSFSIVFILLALSMFGFYELQLPASLQSRISSMSNKQNSGSYTGVAIMGFLSALIVGPCVAPPLAGALIYIGQTGDAILGGVALFAMSIGMGLPLLLLGASAGKLLPKAGVWMDNVKAVFGVLLIAVAIWMAERIIPAQAAMAAWAMLLIISAVYMGAFESTQDKSGWMKLVKGLALTLFIYGSIIMIGLLGGSTQVFQPLKIFQGGGQGQVASEKLEFKTIKSYEDLQGELAKGQPVMLDFYADWCVSCKEMEVLTFTDSEVHTALKGVTLIKADVTPNDDIDKALMKQFGIIGPPAILFFTPDGQEQKAQRVVGFKNAEDFVSVIQKAYQNDRQL